MPEHTSRRTLLRVLALGGAVGAAGLAGCELPRVERDDAGTGEAATTATGSATGQPPTAAEPTDVADVEALEAALARTRTLAALARRVRGRAARPLVRTARDTLTTQAAVLQELLAAAGVEAPPDDAVASGPGPRPPGLGRELRRDAGRDQLEELSSVTSANLAMLTAVAAHHAALATLLDASPGWEPLAGPTAQSAAGMLDAFRPAVYAFEVLAARTGGSDRGAYEATLTELRRVTRVLTELAGPAAPPAPMGYGLPDGLGSPDGRRALARDVLVALPPAVVRDAGGHTGDVAAVAGTVQVLATSLALGHEWGAPIDAFPGMTLP